MGGMSGGRHTTFAFTLVPTGEQVQALQRHVGASRFAFNQCLRIVQDALATKKQGPDKRVPWSGFDLINAINAWKVSEHAGVDEAGKAGLHWRAEVCQQVFEEAAVDLGRALEAFTAGRKGERSGRAPGFPKFKKKATARQSFRLRNKGSGTSSAIRLGQGDEARSVRLPKLGPIEVRECTRRLRRMVRNGRAKILFATVSFRPGGRWRVSLNVEAAPLHEGRRHDAGPPEQTVGIDRGLTTFAVLADTQGREVERIESPRPLRGALPKLRRRSKELSRKARDSRNRGRARERLARTHARIASVRKDFVHRPTAAW
jgi:putative transposase